MKLLPQSIAGKLYGLVAFFCVCFVVTSVYKAWVLKANLTDFKKTEIQSVVQAAQNVAAKYHALALAGEMTEEAAQKAAKTSLRGMLYQEKDYVFVFNSESVNLVHPVKPKQEGTSMYNSKDGNGKHHIRELVQQAVTKGSGYTSYAWKSPDDVIFDKLSYASHFEPWDWVLGSGVLIDNLDKIFWESALKGVGLTVLFSLVATILGVMIARSVAGSISQLNKHMALIANDELGDEVAGVDRQDEVGEMCRAVAVFRDNALKRLSLEGQADADRARDRDRQTRVTALIADFQTDVRAMLTHVDDNTSSLNTAAQDLKSIANSTEEKSAAASVASEQASSNVQIVAAAAEELRASIEEINRQVAQSTEIVGQAVESAATSNQKVLSLDENAQKIGEVVSLIQAIAEQTNLLALNATIEAARAGEAGKGFAVVASEVKELAMQTSKATEEISSHISAIQGSTRETVKGIEDITKIMEMVNSVTAAIANSVAEQGKATGGISVNVQEAAQGTQLTSNNMHDVAEGATSTLSTADGVLSTSNQTAKSTSELRHKIETFLSNVAAA